MKGYPLVLNGATTAKATFTAPTNLQSDTTLSFTLTVTDNHLKTSNAIQKVTVKHTVTTPPPPPPPPPPGTGSGIDKFGIKEIYPSKPGGEQWYFNTNDPNSDPRAGKGEGPPTTFVQRNSDGSWKVKSSEVRYGALTWN